MSLKNFRMDTLKEKIEGGVEETKDTIEVKRKVKKEKVGKLKTIKKKIK